MKVKKFENLLKSEIAKAEKAANEFYGTKNAKVTGYSYSENIDELLFMTVECEICFDYKTRAEHDVVVNVCMFDRRKSFATVKTW